MRKQRRKLEESYVEESSGRGGRGRHQARSLKASEGDVDPITVFKPDLAFPAPVNDLLPEA